VKNKKLSVRKQPAEIFLRCSRKRFTTPKSLFLTFGLVDKQMLFSGFLKAHFSASTDFNAFLARAV